ncbi:hypothetical protein OG777_02575 [Micromonospora peucetia]|uniref:Uncharacterized protein n=2 Tax=Micromonospora peucetia TaxID=47871 RepID=A0A1C6TZR4_9ACTN|nr:hypothetical protein [Micromonospora peucetia]MCX4385814.1 hypothetical protein [Micromonospora peucetia]WSA33196.1 hypothetical protein OIE14_03745 [Micromonospora peucetia]SCL47322.1 hypothetical protein GA0070608_0201 [Micromonospora peucetia]
MSTQAASTRPMNRPTQDAQNRAMQEAPTRPMPTMGDGHREQMPSPGTETKQSFLTTEFWIYAAAVAVVVIAAFWRGPATNGLNINNPNQAWWYLTILTVGYLGSRGLAKAGSARRSGAERSMRRR